MVIDLRFLQLAETATRADTKFAPAQAVLLQCLTQHVTGDTPLACLALQAGRHVCLTTAGSQRGHACWPCSAPVSLGPALFLHFTLTDC